LESPPAALLYIGTPMTTASRHGPPLALPHKRGHEILRHITVNTRANGNASQDIGPDIADDFAYGGETALDALAERQVIRGGGSPYLRHVAHPILQVRFHLQSVHLIACHKGVNENQAVSLLGFPDATIVTPAFGVYVA
jgi:hypothetical protein